MGRGLIPTWTNSKHNSVPGRLNTTMDDSMSQLSRMGVGRKLF
jgi:hypothetical protein